MSRGEAARARGLTYSAAKNWEVRHGVEFARKDYNRGRRLDYAERDARWVRTLEWARRHALCNRDLARLMGLAETSIARRAKRHEILLPRAYGTWHTDLSARRMTRALSRAFSDLDTPAEAQRVLAKMMDDGGKRNRNGKIRAAWDHWGREA